VAASPAAESIFAGRRSRAAVLLREMWSTSRRRVRAPNRGAESWTESWRRDAALDMESSRWTRVGPGRRRSPPARPEEDKDRP